jgi:site-specific DNA-cytosine methylase
LFPPEIVNAKNFGVPQNRERTIVEDEWFKINFEYPKPFNEKVFFEK